MSPLVPSERQYRCPCGHQNDVSLKQDVVCSACGRRIAVAALDATQTMSFFTSTTGDSSRSTAPRRFGYEDRSGEQIGYFRLEGKLGEGGMGAVYRALDESLQRYVAVKVMRSAAGHGSSADRVSRLLDEAVAQARVNHPNIVTIYYVGRDEEEPFFAMELLPGPTVEEELRKGPLPYTQVIQLSSQIVGALSQSSRQGLVHGDIKPSNLLFSGPNVVKLGDFGLATTPETAASRGISGTLSYMSPELAEGGSPSEKSDMYALGVTLFEMTFGRRPYALRGETLSDQLLEHRTASLEFPEKWPTEIPLAWRGVLERLLAKDPEQRFDSYELLQHELRKLMPLGVTHAGFLTRVMAFLVDATILAVLMTPLGLPALINGSFSLEPPYNYYMLAASLLLLLVPAVPGLFAWLEWRGYRTPGRYLFQLRVVDAHGLPLDPNRRLIRSVMRHSMFWIWAITWGLAAVGIRNLSFALGFVDELSLLVNFMPFFFGRHLVLHDRICNSHVALDTRNAAGRQTLDLG